MIMADGGDDGGRECVLFKRPSCGCASYSTTASGGGMLGDGICLLPRAARKQFLQGICHASGEIAVLFGAPRLLPSAPDGAPISVFEALVFSALQRGILHQNALALVAPPRPAEANHHSGKSAVLFGASRKGSVATAEVDKMIEIGAA